MSPRRRTDRPDEPTYTGRNTMPKLYRHRFTVHGTGRFPADMLRYDACYPATGLDASKIQDNDNTSGPCEVTLVHVGAKKDWTPTQGRWSSFLWGVKQVEGPWVLEG